MYVVNASSESSVLEYMAIGEEEMYGAYKLTCTSFDAYGTSVTCTEGIMPLGALERISSQGYGEIGNRVEVCLIENTSDLMYYPFESHLAASKFAGSYRVEKPYSFNREATLVKVETCPDPSFKTVLRNLDTGKLVPQRISTGKRINSQDYNLEEVQKELSKRADICSVGSIKVDPSVDLNLGDPVSYLEVDYYPDQEGMDTLESYNMNFGTALLKSDLLQIQMYRV